MNEDVPTTLESSSVALSASPAPAALARSSGPGSGSTAQTPGAAPSTAPDLVLSRRSLLRGAAAAGGGLVAVGLAACANGNVGWTMAPATPAAGASAGASAGNSSAPGTSAGPGAAPTPTAMDMNPASPGASVAAGATPAPDMDALAEAVIKRFPEATDKVGNQPLAPKIDGDTKVFELECSAFPWHIDAKLPTVNAIGYNGTWPGPLLRVTEGDKVRVIVTNKLTESTGVHFHGQALPNAMDGVPYLTQPPIKPGGQFTYEFVARPYGSHMYHSHHNATDQVGRGMLGAFIVEPKDPALRYQVDQDIVWISNDELGGFTINGKGFPATTPIVAKKGQRVLIRFMNEGIMTHPWHMHGMHFQVVARDGFPLGSAAFRCDTLGVNPGERWDVIVDCDNVGTWAFHCHILPHAEGPSGMYGMVTAIVVKE